MSTNFACANELAGSTYVADREMEPRWYAAYTSANHEKKAAAELERRGVESFLPVYTSIRRWSDRRQELKLPLFPGYVFVHFPLRERLRVLQVLGVARLVGFGGVATPLPDEQMETLRRGWIEQMRGEPHPFLTVGRRVRVVRGALLGLEGIVSRKKGKYRIVVTLEAILRSIAVEIDSADLEPVKPCD